MKATKIKNLFFYTLTVSASPAGSGSVQVAPLKNNYVNHEQVILTAVPGVDYEFLNWSGGASGSDNPLTITMDSNKSITAVFQNTAPPPVGDIYTLTVDVWPTGSGSVAVDPQKPLYAQDERVTLTAIPASGNAFDIWAGDGNGAAHNPLTVYVWHNLFITANFKVPVQGMEVPAGGIIMYTGSDTPAGFTKVEGLAFVRVSPDTSVNKTATANNVSGHTHAIPASSTDGAHVHYTSGSTSSSSTTSYYYWGQAQKFASAGHAHSTSSQNTSSSGGHSHEAMTSNAAGDINPPFLKLNFIKNTSGGPKVAPIGSIVMVDYATPPNGWAICNGENGTVNLSNKFAYGVANNTELLVSGGSETHTHAAKETGSAGAHTHTYSPTINQGGGSVGIDPADSSGVGMSKTPHTHTVPTFTTATQAAHAHTYPETSAANHLPPYVYLFYIQRIT